MNTEAKISLQTWSKNVPRCAKFQGKEFPKSLPHWASSPVNLQNQAGTSEMHTAEKQGALVHFRQCIMPICPGPQHLRGALVLSHLEENHWKQRFMGGNEVPVHPGKVLLWWLQLQGLTQCLAHRRCSTNSYYMTNKKKMEWVKELKSFCVHCPPYNSPSHVLWKKPQDPCGAEFFRLCLHLK